MAEPIVPNADAQEESLLFKLKLAQQKERSPAKAAAVAKVVRSGQSSAEKLSAINQIDLSPESDYEAGQAAPAAGRPARGGDSPEREDGPPGDAAEAPAAEAAPDAAPRAETAPRNARRLRGNFIVEPPRGGIFSWIFGQQRQVRAFGEATQTIKRGSFPFTLRPDPRAADWFAKEISGLLLPDLNGLLQPVLRRGWLHLQKNAYNCVALLGDLALSLARASVNPADAANYRKSVAAFAPHYLVLATQNRLRALVRSALEDAAGRLALQPETRKRGLDAFARLFAKERNACTLDSLVRAPNMLASLRWLECADLAPRFAIEIAEDAFDCPALVQEDIDREYARQAIELRKLYAEFANCRALHYFLRPQSTNRISPDPSPLKDLTGLDPFRYPVDNPALITLRFNDAFIRRYKPLICNQARLGDGSLVEPFPAGLIHAQLGRMEILCGRLGKLATTLPNFSRHRYRQVIASRRDAEPPELETADILREYAGLLNQLGGNLSGIIRSRAATGPDWVRQEPSQSGSNPIPGEDAPLAEPAELQGQTVFQAICACVSHCWLQAIELGQDEVLLPWQRMDPILIEARERIDELRRIGTPAKAAETESQVPFAPVGYD